MSSGASYAERKEGFKRCKNALDHQNLICFQNTFISIGLLYNKKNSRQMFSAGKYSIVAPSGPEFLNSLWGLGTEKE
jgi:hypothetical protein